MCDEYYDERVRALWRALAERDETEALEDDLDAPIVVPLAPEPAGPDKRNAKRLVR